MPSDQVEKRDAPISLVLIEDNRLLREGIVALMQDEAHSMSGSYLTVDQIAGILRSTADTITDNKIVTNFRITYATGGRTTLPLAADLTIDPEVTRGSSGLRSPRSPAICCCSIRTCRTVRAPTARHNRVARSI